MMKKIHDLNTYHILFLKQNANGYKERNIILYYSIINEKKKTLLKLSGYNLKYDM